MESPGRVSERAFEMVLQACWRDSQLLLSLPCTPSTYHLLLAMAIGAKANSVSATTHISFSDFIFPPCQCENTHTHTQPNQSKRPQLNRMPFPNRIFFIAVRAPSS